MASGWSPIRRRSARRKFSRCPSAWRPGRGWQRLADVPRRQWAAQARGTALGRWPLARNDRRRQARRFRSSPKPGTQAFPPYLAYDPAVDRWTSLGTTPSRGPRCRRSSEQTDERSSQRRSASRLPVRPRVWGLIHRPKLRCQRQVTSKSTSIMRFPAMLRVRPALIAVLFDPRCRDKPARVMAAEPFRGKDRPVRTGH